MQIGATNDLGLADVDTPESWLVWIGARWLRLKRLYVFVLPLRMSALALAVVAFALVWSGQGRDVVAALVEHDDSGIAVHRVPRVCFVPLVTLLAFQIWFWSRQLLRLRFEGHPEAIEFPRAARLLPRLLGVLAYVVAMAAIGRVAWQSRHDPTAPWGAIALLELLLVVGAVGFFVFCSARRRWLERTKRDHLFAQKDRVTLLPRSTRGVLGGTLVLAGVFFWLATFRVQTAGLLGSSAILILSMSLWVSIGSALVYVGSRARVPLLSWLLLAACLVSPWTDNHVVAVIEPGLPARPSVEQAFATWHDRLVREHPNEPHPVFIAAAEGGGIRAAYWTATVLAALADDVPGFREHLFAISGVSGGSLGAGVFDALLAAEDGLRPPRLESRRRALADLLARDALAPTLAAMLQPDLVQRWNVLPFVLPDRGRALEGGWETAWDGAIGGDNRMVAGFLRLFRGDDRLPALFLNGTVVETGQRIIASNLDFTRDRSTDGPTDGDAMFADSLDLLDAIGGDLRLSTAIHNSARFTYVSPAGTVRRGATSPPTGSRLGCRAGDPCEHVIDGGYFENSGTVTAADIASVVRQQGDVRPYVLIIRYREKAPEPLRSERWVTEASSPIVGMLNTREARGTLAVEQLARASGAEPIVFELLQYPRALKLPLGWLLAAQTRVMIDRQMGPQSRENGRSMEQVATLLGTAVRPDPFHEAAMRSASVSPAVTE